MPWWICVLWAGMIVSFECSFKTRPAQYIIEWLYLTILAKSEIWLCMSLFNHFQKSINIVGGGWLKELDWLWKRLHPPGMVVLGRKVGMPLTS